MGCESANEQKHLKNTALPIQQVKLTQSENAILQCKSCRDKIKKYIRSLEQKEEKPIEVKEKRRYFRVEKTKFNHSGQKEKNSKQIFKTQKDYHLSKGKLIREFKRIKPIKTSNKFITSMNMNSNLPDKENNSFVVQKIIPKKLKVIKEPKDESKQFSTFWKSPNNILVNSKKIFTDEQNINFCLNNISKEEENKINNYKIKLMLVYFSSIKNLCKYINTNLFNNSFTEQKAIDDLISQLYQSLQILDRKINEFMNFKNIKDDVKVNKEDFEDISSLKENLLLMKNVLNNSMSQNLINIYLDIDNFCKLYDRSKIV